MAGVGPVGDAVMLFDLCKRVVGFINDLRHAQDDLIGLRSEAECLRICINALNSQEARATLTYVSMEQKHDLRTIIKGCEQNMEDLNRFIASVEVIITGPNNPKSGSMTLGKYLRHKLAKGFAKFKFTMKDKQPFRDKLMLPTASINIFLTSLTHFRLTMLLGSMPLPTTIPLPTYKTPTQTVPLKGWEAIGRRVAFTSVAITSEDLELSGIEDEIVECALKHINKRKSGAGRDVRGRVPSISNSGRKASRSRNRGGIRKKNGQLYVRRQKSVSRMPDGIERVDRMTYESDSDSGPEVLLIEPPPDTSSSYRPRRSKLVDSDDESSVVIRIDSTPTDRDNRTAERLRRAEEEVRRERIVRDQDEYEREHAPQPRTRTGLPRSEENDLRNSIKQRIEREKREFIAQISRVEQEPERVHSRMAKRSREEDAYVSTHPEAEEFEKLLNFLEEEYGVIVEDIGNSRPPVDNGFVGDIDDLPSDPEDTEPIVPRHVQPDSLRAETSRYHSNFDPGFRDAGYKKRSDGVYDAYSRPYGGSYKPDKPGGVSQTRMSSERLPQRPLRSYWESSEDENYSDRRRADKDKRKKEKSRHTGESENIRIVDMGNEDMYNDDRSNGSRSHRRERPRTGRSSSGIEIVHLDYDDVEDPGASYDTYTDSHIHGPPYPRLNADRRASHSGPSRDRHGSVRMNPPPGSGQPPRGILRRRRNDGTQQDDDSDDPLGPMVVRR